MTNKEILKKSGIEIKAAELKENRGSGAAAVIGNMDRGGDVIFPGAFKSCIKGFLQDGFIARGHDWEDDPIGYPVSAKETGNQLVCEWEYHSTEDAQKARTVAMERIAAGKSVGLSIGFQIDFPDGRTWFESGADLLKFAQDNGYDLSLFDTKSIKAWKGACRAITKIASLFEFSQVTVPMNPEACAMDVKSAGADQEDAPEPADNAETTRLLAQARQAQAAFAMSQIPA